MRIRKRKVFVSAATRDLASYRVVAENVLLHRGYDAVLHDTLSRSLTYLQIREKLLRAIQQCDAVICIVGECYGSEPADHPDGQPRRSYTQIEYDIGRDLKKPIFLLIAGSDTVFDQHECEPTDAVKRQLEYRDHIRRDHDWQQFESRDQLREKLTNLRFPWEQSSVSRRAMIGASLVVLLAITTVYSLTSNEDSFSKFERYLDLPTTQPPAQPQSKPPETIESIITRSGAKVETGTTGPHLLRFNNDSTMDVVLTFKERRSNLYRSRVSIRRNSVAEAPGGKDLSGYCFFVARTPGRDYELGWVFLYDVETQEFKLVDSGVGLALTVIGVD